MIVLYDTREQRPLVDQMARFLPKGAQFEAAALKAGDYCVQGGRTKNPVELKRGHDWARCLSTAAEKKRWGAQVERLVKYAEDPLIVFTWPPSWASVQQKTKGKVKWYKEADLWENLWAVQQRCRALVVGTDGEAAEVIAKYLRRSL